MTLQQVFPPTRYSVFAIVTVAASATATDTLTMAKGVGLISIETDKAAWVRIYESAAASTADAARDRATAPTVNTGVIAEVITTGAQTIALTPSILAFNQELPATAVYPIRVTNDAGTADVVVTASFIPLQS